MRRSRTAAGARPTTDGCATRDLLAECARARGPAPRRSPRSTSRCGTSRGRRAGRPVLAAARRARRCRRSRSTRRSRPRTAQAPPRRPRAARAAGFGCVKVKVGLGDDAGAARGGACRGRTRDGDPARRQRRLDGRGGDRVAARARAGRARAAARSRSAASTRSRRSAAHTTVPVALDEIGRAARAHWTVASATRCA